MIGVVFGFFVISLLLFLGAFNYFLLSQKGGAYPPKRVLLQKALGFTLIGGIVFVIACMLLIFNK